MSAWESHRHNKCGGQCFYCRRDRPRNTVIAATPRRAVNAHHAAAMLLGLYAMSGAGNEKEAPCQSR